MRGAGPHITVLCHLRPSRLGHLALLMFRKTAVTLTGFTCCIPQAPSMQSVEMQSVEYTGDHADRPRRRENFPFWSVHVVALVGPLCAGWSWEAFWWLIGG